MFKTIISLTVIISIIVLAGCGSQMSVHTYMLPQGDTSWNAISMVLDQEWQEHSTMSNAKRNGDSAVVKTTARAHRKIEEALKTKTVAQ